MSPLGGYSVVLAPSSDVFHRSRWTEAKGRVTLCGKSVTDWWQSSTEYQGLFRFLRRHCSVCFARTVIDIDVRAGREGAMRALQVVVNG